MFLQMQAFTDTFVILFSKNSNSVVQNKPKFYDQWQKKFVAAKICLTLPGLFFYENLRAGGGLVSPR